MPDLLPGDIVYTTTSQMGLQSMGTGIEYVENVIRNDQTALQNTRTDCDVTADGSLVFASMTATPYVAKINAVTGVRAANPSTLPAGAANAIKLSPDGTEVIVAHNNTPYFTRYNTSDMSKLSDPSTVPTGNGNKVAYSADGNYLAIGHASSPYVSIYNRSDMSKIANPATLPASSGLAVDFSANGTWLAVGFSSSPRLRVYKLSDWSVETLSSSISTGQLNDVSFSPDSTMLACVSSSGGAANTIYVYNTSTWAHITLPSLSSYKMGSARKVGWFGNRVIGVVMDASPGAAIFIDVVSAQVVGYFDLAVSTINGACFVPGGSFRRLAGTVEDESSAPLIRPVRAYDRATGRMVAKTNSLSDGTFEMRVYNSRAVYALALGTSPEDTKLIDRINPAVIV